MMYSRSFLKPLCLLLALTCNTLVISITAAEKRPNILVIMADDVGFSDLGCYGSNIQTPNLDSLAQNGIRFTQFYNMARCCPTRASLLTGLYPHQAGMGHMMTDNGHEGYRGNLNRSCVTIAEVMRENGYRTYMGGKWHVTRFEQAKADKLNWPMQRGFEKYYGTVKGGGSYYDPTALCRQNTYITPENDPEYKPSKFYYTAAISDNIVRFLEQHQTESPDKPFFTYVAYTAAHWPMHALEKDIQKYKGKFDGGYGPAREARLKKLKQLGLLDPKWAPAPQTGDWNSVENKARESRCMEVYAAMLDNMDQGIGRIIGQLKKSGQFENTLILYLQDNGGCAENMGRERPTGEAPKNLKPFGPNDLQPQVWPPMQTRDGRWVQTGPEVMPGPEDTYIAYGEGWANVSNTPFREYKHWVHEGGISTPLIVHWPKGIPEKNRGKLESQPSHLIDIMATCVEVGAAKYPAEYKGEKIKPLEGVTLLPAFHGKTLARKEPLFWEHESNRALRDGKWKLVAKENQPWELYNMEKDRTEMNNLATKNPKKVEELAAKWDSMAATRDVLPLGTWRKTSPRKPAPQPES